jgi:hypothetical protein
MRYLLIGVAIAALSGSAIAATNILPGSGDTVTGSSIHSGFDPAIAGANLINGTSNAAYSNGDPRWVFADGSSADQTLIVDLGSDKSVDYAGFVYSGQDRVPTSFEVLTSTNGISFTSVAGPGAVPYGLPGLYDTAYSFAPVSAQYVEYDFGSNSYTTGCPGCGGGVGEGAGIVSLDIQAVPEPATWAMMLLGVGMIGGGLRMARRKNGMALATA